MKQGRENLSRLPVTAMLAIAFLMVAAIALLSYTNGRSRELAAEQSGISRQIQDTTNDLLSLTKDAETGQRGFLITGQELYLEPYNKAVAAVPGIFQKLEMATRDRPDQASRVLALRPVVEAKFRELAETVSLRRAQGFEPARKVVETDLGKHLMDDIRAGCAAMNNAAARRVADFTAQAEISSNRLRIVSTIGALILLVFIVFLTSTVLSGMAVREKLYHVAASNAEHFRVTLASIGDAVIATDAHGKITFINRVAQELTAWSEREALGVEVSQVFNIVNETTRNPVESPLGKAIATGTIVGLANHTILLARNGREIPIDDSGSPIRADGGAIEGGILVFRDISVRRNTERLLKASNDQLREFVDAAAHDLRAPLRSVNIFAQMLKDRYSGQLASEGEEYLLHIRNGIQRMGQLLEDLLHYAHAGHIGADGSGVPVQRVPMAGALLTVLENLSADIENAKAVVTSADALPVVPVHDTHLVQLLQNLIGNAIKYRGDEGPRIQVNCAKTETGWTVRVTDNGIGIDPQYAEVIFQPFKRLHNEDLPGTGIGLATCQKIVVGYGGKIWVESQPGKGSTFFFTIPDFPPQALKT
jgi:PAS domain S-box-containing protein